MKQQSSEKTQSSWRHWWIDVFDVFNATFKLIAAHFRLFIIFCLIYWVFPKPWHMFPHNELLESQLRTFSILNWFIVSLLRLAVTLAAWNISLSALRGRAIRFPRNLHILFGHTCLFVVGWIVFYQFVWIPVFVKLANPLYELSGQLNHQGALNSMLVLSTGYLGEIPYIVLTGMFGFVLVARGAGESISFRQSLAMVRLSPAPLVIILLLWLVGESVVSQVAFAIASYSGYYPLWLTQGVHIVYAPFFWIVAAVLYERHRRLALSGVDYGQYQD